MCVVIIKFVLTLMVVIYVPVKVATRLTDSSVRKVRVPPQRCGHYVMHSYLNDTTIFLAEGAENSVSLLIILIPLVGVVLLLGVIATIVVCVIVCCVRRNKTYKKFDIPEIKKRYKKSDDTVEADIES